MVLRKAVKRGAGAGNKNPVKRQGFPDCDQDKLDEAIDCYIRSMGVAASFDLLEYKHLQAQQAEQPKAVYKLHKLVESLLKVSPSGQIKYEQLRQALQVACNRFGVELLSPHWPVESQWRGTSSRKGCRCPMCVAETLEEADSLPDCMGEVWQEA